MVYELFYLFMQQPPRFTLFPYRRSSDLSDIIQAGDILGTENLADEFANSSEAVLGVRSEEHTSELQSRPQIVCRLLLEKKKSFYILKITIYLYCFSKIGRAHV